MTPSPFPARQSVDPIYRSSFRECVLILSLWAACCLYTVTYCYLYGYLVHEPHPGSTGPAIGELLGPLEAFDRQPQSLTTPLGLGVPDWVFYGILAPWVIAIAAIVIFCFFFYSEEDLNPPGGEPAGLERIHD